MSLEVPKWKKDLILKKQQWKSQGGWSVPPHPVLVPRAVKHVRAPQIVSFDSTGKTSSKTLTNGLFCKLSDSPKKRPVSAQKPLDLHEESFGSVSDLRAIFQPPEENRMTKSRSVENILDEGPMENSRRASTSYEPDHIPKIELTKKSRAVPNMEDFFKKYRKTGPRKLPFVLDVSETPRSEKTGRKDHTMYFVDMNKNELPSPNIVKQTVRVFEYPQIPVETQIERPLDVPDDVTHKTRTVVEKFEAKIKSQPEKVPNPPKRSPNSKNRSATTSNFSDSSSTDDDKDATFNSTEFSKSSGILNISLSSPSTPLNSPIDEKMCDLKTVTINTNQSIIIKTI